MTRYDIAVKLHRSLRRYINTSEPDESMSHINDMYLYLSQLKIAELKRDKVSDKEGDDAPYVEGETEAE